MEPLIRQGFSVNVKDELRSDTLLHVALRKDFVTTSLYFLTQGADLNARNDFAETPLHVATRAHAHYGVIEELLKLGANPNVKNWKNNTPSHIIFENEEVNKEYAEDLLRLLKKFNADFTVLNDGGKSAGDVALNAGIEL